MLVIEYETTSLNIINTSCFPILQLRECFLKFIIRYIWSHTILTYTCWFHLITIFPSASTCLLSVGLFPSLSFLTFVVLLFFLFDNSSTFWCISIVYLVFKFHHTVPSTIFHGPYLLPDEADYWLTCTSFYLPQCVLLSTSVFRSWCHDARILSGDDLRCLVTSPAERDTPNILLEAPLTLLSCICISLFMPHLGSIPSGLAEVVSCCLPHGFLAGSTFSTWGCFT